ncbi:MAG TPA: hypothetical protein VM432_06815 [Bdellovibrionales bacterium]|nr:hypothetical protein [Bdellovibrionales bacterium]
MKTSPRIKLKSVLIWTLFMVLCLGQTVSARENSATSLQMHIPWNLLSERLRTIAESNNSSIQKTIESEQLEVAGLHLHLSRILFVAKPSIDQAIVNETGASINLSSSTLAVGIEKVSVDQIIEREINGAVIRVHLKASCGPIQLHQSKIGLSSIVAFDWTAETPKTSISKLDLDWSTGSWTLAPFSCEGPSGIDTILQDEIRKQFDKPEVFKPYFTAFLSSYLKNQAASLFNRLKTPLTLQLGKSTIEVSIGRLNPQPTGITLSLELDSQSSAPGSDVLLNASTLPNDKPVLIGDISVLEFFIQKELEQQPTYFSLELHKIDAFASLMKSRFLQFFVWQDLWNYPKNYPFYLRLFNPLKLKLSKSGANRFSTSLPLNAVLQSYRDGQWWNYVTAQGSTQASVAFDLKNGALEYSTSFDKTEASIDYGAEYRSRFKKSGKPPGSTVLKALNGNQMALSGKVVWPEIDLGYGGKYRVEAMTWIDGRVFYVSLAQP